MTHLVAEGLSVVLVEVSTSQRPFMVRIQLLKAMQCHHSFLPHKVFGVVRQPSHSWQHCIDEVWADELPSCSQRCADCQNPQQTTVM